MEWRVVAQGLEMRLGVLTSRAEVFDAAANQLRVDLTGGEVASFVFSDEGGPARSVTMSGIPFQRVEERR
jgi:hypothetical protein